jgi:hypothetical protein
MRGRFVLLLVGLAASAIAGAERAPETHDGAFDSSLARYRTRLWIVEGEGEAVVLYSGEFGYGHTCELGPVLLPRASESTYRWADDTSDPVENAGTILIERSHGSWGVTLEKRAGFGGFGYCGSGWNGDTFRARGTPPRSCVVGPEGARLFMPAAGTGDGPPVASSTMLARGERVSATAFFTNGDYVLARAGRKVGLLLKTSLRCGSRSADRRTDGRPR